MLFNLYINDIPKSLKCNHLLFADDMKLYQNISAIQDAHTLQRDSNLVVSWCKNNKMTLNLDKCAVMTYHRINKPIAFNYYLDGKSQEPCPLVT